MIAPLPHAHDPGLVVVSIIIAILASYTALDLAGRVTAAHGSARFSWLVGGATAMGIGIWSMHFTAMLAFKLPIPVAYDVPTVIISLLVAIVASGLALFVSSRQTMSLRQLGGGGVVMGIAIAGMHYIGMAAMRLQATLGYDPLFFMLSIVIAISASLAALWLAFKFRGDAPTAWNRLKILSAVIMGGAISGMHYTGMHAAIFLSNDELVVDLSWAVDTSALGATSIALGTFMVLALVLFLSLVDQRFAVQAAYLTENEERHSLALQRLNTELERHVSNLRLVAEVSRATTSILDQEQLVHEVIEQIRSTFNYYHVHMYLFDETQAMLWVVGGTGQAGQTMVANGHKIPKGKGLVGRAAALNRVVLVPDVSLDSNWLPNPLLPDTKAEVAVPIILGQEVLGVLDVQDASPNGLNQKDAELLQLIANQVAIALHNARLFAELETALTRAQAVQEQYLEHSWEKATLGVHQGQYHYTRSGAITLSEASQVEARQQAMTRIRPTIVSMNGIENETPSKEHPDEQNYQSIVAPIRLRNKLLGVLHLHPMDSNQRWTEEDLAVVEAVVDQLAQTAENLRLFEETRGQAGRERTIREITNKLQTAANLDSLLEIAARELGQQLGVRHTVLELGIDSSLATSLTSSDRLSSNGR